MAKFRLLVTTAIAATLSAGVAAHAGLITSETTIAAAVPVPEPADLKPLTPADVIEQRGVQPSTAAPVTTPDQKAVDAIPVPTDPVAVKIKELLDARADRMFVAKKDFVAAQAFYAARNYAPVWSKDGAATDRARAAISYLGTVENEGLDPADYRAPSFKTATSPDQAAEADLRMSATLLAYAHHAQNGRINPNRVVKEVAYNAEMLDPADALAKISDAKDIAKTLAGFNPQHPQYQKLKAMLADLRGGSVAGQIQIGKGSALKLAKSDVHDARVPDLRERLGLPAKNDDIYDRELADEISAFQKAHGLRANGELTAATVDALNGVRRDHSREIEIVVANMERWRWLSHDLGKAFSMLNIPDYTLKVYRDQQVLWQTRVVVGQTAKPTPLLTETMKFVTINPTWHVPPSIVHNEYLPALARDPGVLARYGLRVNYSGGSVSITQPPGDHNALGRIRFNFPNKFLVYQHDTPDKNLFALSRRAFSHGCQRVQDPVKYAEVMTSLGASETYSQERIRRMIAAGSETDIKFVNPIPVHITYQTAFVDDAGHLQFRDDVYGEDARLIAALKSEHSGIVDIPMVRAQPATTVASSSSKKSNRAATSTASTSDTASSAPAPTAPAAASSSETASAPAAATSTEAASSSAAAGTSADANSSATASSAPTPAKKTKRARTTAQAYAGSPSLFQMFFGGGGRQAPPSYVPGRGYYR
jgi:murein L,D-transpeptidase YcbB/YkuD